VQEALRSVNHQISKGEAEEIVRLSDKNNDKFIQREEFQAMLLPKLKEQILMYEDNLEDLRKMFVQADKDSSGFLSKAELKGALMGIQVDLDDQQLSDLFYEMDSDPNSGIDIDEFVAYLSIADRLKFRNPKSKTTLINIKRARSLNPIEFYQCFKRLPSSFSLSFTQERLCKIGSNTPSYGLYPQFNCRTMTYKDLQHLFDLDKTLPKRFVELNAPKISAELTIEEATGVPLPKKEDYEWSKIMYRELRAVLFDFQKKEYVSNSILMGATWRQEYDAKWVFAGQQAGKNAFYVNSD